MAERFICSIKGWIHKYMTDNENNSFLSALPSITASYNLRQHRSLPKGITPTLATLPENKSKVYDHLYTRRYKQRPDERFNLMLGDAVTIPKVGLFSKGFRSGNWNCEVLFVR